MGPQKAENIKYMNSWVSIFRLPIQINSQELWFLFTSCTPKRRAELEQKWLCHKRTNRWIHKWQATLGFLPGESHGPEPARLLCPWKFPCKNTGVGCCFLLQGIWSLCGQREIHGVRKYGALQCRCWNGLYACVQVAAVNEWGVAPEEE